MLLPEGILDTGFAVVIFNAGASFERAVDDDDDDDEDDDGKVVTVVLGVIGFGPED